MIKPKYKEMYKEQQFNYKYLLDWVSHLLNFLKEKNIINYKVSQGNGFYDIIQIKTLDKKKHYYIATELWDSELAETLKGSDKE